MKILLATYNYPPESYGGSEIYVAALAAELQLAGHHPQVVCGGARPVENGERFVMRADSQDGVPVWRLSINGALFTMREQYSTRAGDLLAFWKQWLGDPAHRPDVLHLQGNTLAVSDSLLEAAKSLGIPVLFTLHNVPELCPHGDFITWRGTICDGKRELVKCARCVGSWRKGPAIGAALAAAAPLLSMLPVPEGSRWPSWKTALHYPGLLRTYLSAQQQRLALVDRWHVFSQWSRHALEVNGTPPQKITLLRHTLFGERGAATCERGAATRERGAASAVPVERCAADVLRLGFFGRFNVVKGVPTLLEAVSRLPNAPLQLEIFGQAQNDSEAEIEQQVKQAAARDPRILWRGRIPHEQQPAALANLDVVVVPSLWVETGPLTVLEAFAAGLPVVGSDLSGINEWVEEGRNGWLFPRGDSTALAARLAELSANPKMVAEARAFPAFESPAAHTAKIIEMYSALLSSQERD